MRTLFASSLVLRSLRSEALFSTLVEYFSIARGAMPKEIKKHQTVLEAIRSVDIISDLLEKHDGHFKYELDLEVIAYGRNYNGKKVGPYVHLYEYEAGEEIIREGDWGGNTFYITVEGSLDVYVARPRGGRRPQGRGDSAGASASARCRSWRACRATPPSASPTARKARVLEVTRPALRLLRKLPKFGHDARRHLPQARSESHAHRRAVRRRATAFAPRAPRQARRRPRASWSTPSTTSSSARATPSTASSSSRTAGCGACAASATAERSGELLAEGLTRTWASTSSARATVSASKASERDDALGLHGDRARAHRSARSGDAAAARRRRAARDAGAHLLRLLARGRRRARAVAAQQASRLPRPSARSRRVSWTARTCS